MQHTEPLKHMICQFLHLIFFFSILNCNLLCANTNRNSLARFMFMYVQLFFFVFFFFLINVCMWVWKSASKCMLYTWIKLFQKTKRTKTQTIQETIHRWLFFLFVSFFFFFYFFCSFVRLFRTLQYSIALLVCE